MEEGTRVKFSEARQIVRRLGREAEAAGPSTDIAPRPYFEQLRAEERLDEAAEFLAQALPRYEAVAWAANTVGAWRTGADRDSPEAAALRAALRWVENPTEDARRAAAVMAEAAASSSPERVAALAVFASGGSMAPAEFEAVPAPRELAGVLAAAAVCLAVNSAPDRDLALSEALDAGALLATGSAEDVAA